MYFPITDLCITTTPHCHIPFPLLSNAPFLLKNGDKILLTHGPQQTKSTTNNLISGLPNRITNIGVTRSNEDFVTV
jgi:hypothetical protein